MTPAIFLSTAIVPAARLLPPYMDTDEARAMLLTIALQESKLRARVQLGGGPARSYYQFELGGIRGVLEHPASGGFARSLCAALDIVPSPRLVSNAITYHDVLATVFARLLLWTLPDTLPKREEVNVAWYQYVEGWRPGQPRAESWPGNYREAWSLFPPTAPTTRVADV